MATHMMPQVMKQVLEIFESRSDLIVFETLLRTGCRTHELRSISFTSSSAHIKAAKGSRDHQVPLPDVFLARIAMHWPAHVDTHKHLSHESYKATLRRLFSRLRDQYPVLRPYSLHSLRSAFAISIQTETGDLTLTQALLGHKSLSSTSHYLAAVNIEQSRSRILKAVG